MRRMLAAGPVDLRAGEQVGELGQGDLVAVAQTQGVVVGVVAVGEDTAGGRRLARLGRGVRGVALGDGRRDGGVDRGHGAKVSRGRRCSSGKGDMTAKRRAGAVIGG